MVSDRGGITIRATWLRVSIFRSLFISESLIVRLEEILGPYADDNVPLIQTLLSQHVKPVFHNNLHPKVNASTGRVLSRMAGGDASYQDYYEGQVWKRHPGILNVLCWCIRHLKVLCLPSLTHAVIVIQGRSQDTSYEQLWHLVIPPVMTLLDDYQPKYKLCGVQIASHLLKNAPSELLRRTGIDGLFHQVS